VPGASTEMHLETLRDYRFPDGAVWAAELATAGAPAGEGEVAPPRGDR